MDLRQYSFGLLVIHDDEKDVTNLCGVCSAQRVIEESGNFKA